MKLIRSFTDSGKKKERLTGTKRNIYYIIKLDSKLVYFNAPSPCQELAGGTIARTDKIP